MNPESYLAWVIENTPTCWWHDSADPAELDWALAHGAVGVTTNPFLAHLALVRNRELWRREMREALADVPDAETKAEALMRIPVTQAASKLLPLFKRSEGRRGWVCAQVNPARAGDRTGMLAMARRLHGWSPNITVKLPATAAGLDVLEELVAEGISATATVSFTVAQVLAVAERHQCGAARARRSGLEPGRGFAVLMVGRLDDYLRDIADDAGAGVEEADIRQAGIAVARRARALLKARGAEVGLIIAAFRGLHHMTELVGGEYIMSISPGFQPPLAGGELACEARFERAVPEDVIGRLMALEEFRRAYEPEGLGPERFMAYGLSQRTLAQFVEAGWKLMETMAPLD